MRLEINRRTFCAGLSAASLLTLTQSLPAAALRNGKTTRIALLSRGFHAPAQPGPAALQP